MKADGYDKRLGNDGLEGKPGVSDPDAPAGLQMARASNSPVMLIVGTVLAVLGVVGWIVVLLISSNTKGNVELAWRGAADVVTAIVFGLGLVFIVLGAIRRHRQRIVGDKQ